MAKNKDLKKEDNLSEVENALTKSEQFIEQNQKILSIVVGAAVVIVAAYLGFTKLYVLPKEKAAQEQMFMAEQYFEKDSFNLALNGDGNYLGFLDIIDDYGVTKVADLAGYYSGICYLRLGQYEEAINYLDAFESDDLLLAPVAAGAKGDAYVELNETDKALNAYKKAYSYKNEFTTPVYLMKAGNLLEATGKYADALNLYNEIKTAYPASTEARSVDKYIARAELHLNK
ncbi:MAG: tol-pal system YbgF family protein [Mangrovibacterium sp.]